MVHHCVILMHFPRDPEKQGILIYGKYTEFVSLEEN